MSAQHTPGPWHVVSTKPARFPEYRIIDNAGQYVAAVSIHSHNRATDDARLIAAAPDMLAALKALRDGIDALPDGASVKELREYLQHDCNKLEAASGAIARATGAA